MKIGVSTSTFFNNISTENVFELLRSMRVDTTEVCLNTFSEYEKEFVDNAAAGRRGINVVAVSPLSMQFEPQLFSPNIRVRSDAEAIFKRVCYAAAAFGARYYTFTGPINLSGAKNFEYAPLAQRFNRLCDMASIYGITLSLKNAHWSFASTPEFFRKLLPLCPRLAVTADLYGAEYAGYDIRDFLDAVPAQSINLIEVADVARGEWSLPGRGKYNFERLLADLDRRRIAAPVLISVRSTCYSDFIEVESSVKWLNSLLIRV